MPKDRIHIETPEEIEAARQYQRLCCKSEPPVLQDLAEMQQILVKTGISHHELSTFPVAA